MEGYPKIELYKKRSFNENFNQAFSFIGSHAKPFFKVHLQISLPLSLIASLIYFLGLRQMFISVNPDLVNESNLYNSFGIQIFSGILSMLVSLMVMLCTLVYLKLNWDGLDISPKNVLRNVWPLLGNSFLFGFLYFLAVIVGSILFLIPGIYLAIKLSLGFSSMIFDKKNALDSLERSFFLTKGVWFNLFGTMIVAGIIGYVVQIALALPGYAALGIGSFFEMTEYNQVVGTMTGWRMALLMVLSYIGQGLSIIFITIVTSFYYGSRVEDLEAKSLLADIENYGSEERNNENEDNQY